MASGSTQSKTRIKVLSREVLLTYLQSVQVTQGEQNAGQLAGEGGGVGSVSGNASDPGNPGFLGLYFLGGRPASSSSFASSDTGWTISRTWKETFFNKLRYAIGIRDIGVFNYRFGTVSEIVTVPFKSPKEIYKVELRVVEQIPSVYPIDKRYVEYYVTANDGDEWHRINPLDMPTITGEDGMIVPRTITFNPEIGSVANDLVKYVQTEKPVRALRLRMVLKASVDVPDADQHSPFIKTYKMFMYPKGGLSQP